ncbi:MAG: hypothetical protein AAFW84_12170 [Cyanobacteria bacterium J06635_15]
MPEQTCPCCGSTLLQHMRTGGAYWLCSGCRQEMPIFSNPQPSPNRDSKDVEAVISSTRPVIWVESVSLPERIIGDSLKEVASAEP